MNGSGKRSYQFQDTLLNQIRISLDEYTHARAYLFSKSHHCMRGKQRNFDNEQTPTGMTELKFSKFSFSIFSPNGVQ